MALVGSLQLSGVFTGGTAGLKTIAPAAVAITTGVEDARTVALINGDTTITVPTGTTMVTVTIPITAFTVKMGPTATAAYTICVNPTQPLFLTTPCTSTTFVLAATGAVTVVVDFV